MNKKIAFLTLLVVSLVGCSPSDKPKQNREKVQNEYRSEIKILSDHEHLVIVDIPGERMSDRCVIYVNEKIGKSNMSCPELSTPLGQLDGPESDDSRY